MQLCSGAAYYYWLTGRYDALNYALQYGGVTDSTTVTKPAVHAVMVANHVNPKLQTISCQ